MASRRRRHRSTPCLGVGTDEKEQCVTSAGSATDGVTPAHTSGRPRARRRPLAEMSCLVGFDSCGAVVEPRFESVEFGVEVLGGVV
jgi:hypothetical protein